MLEAGQPYKYKFKFDEKWHEVDGRSGMTLLQATEKAGIRTPHACEEGGCGSCRGVLIGGQVKMRGNNVLEADELQRGQVLACQSDPLTSEVVIDFDIV